MTDFFCQTEDFRMFLIVNIQIDKRNGSIYFIDHFFVLVTKAEVLSCQLKILRKCINL